MNLIKNSDYFPYSINWMVFYNRDGVCLLRGTDWIFIYNQLTGLYNRDGVCLLRGTDWFL